MIGDNSGLVRPEKLTLDTRMYIQAANINPFRVEIVSVESVEC